VTVNLSPFETHTTIKLHRQDLLREAERERLLVSPTWNARLERLLARTGRFLIAIGTRLEARYAPPALSADYADSRRFLLGEHKSV
jgi:hypothetical protein